MEYKAAGICCQLVPSCAACCASLQVRLAVFSSEVTVLCQVVFGLPCFLFPGGVHLKATLGMWSWSTLRTCPSHWSRRCFSFQHYVATVCVFIQVLMGSSQPNRCNMSSGDNHCGMHWSFSHVTLNHSPAFWAVQQNWFNIAVMQSDLFRLYCFDSQMVWRLIHNTVENKKTAVLNWTLVQFTYFKSHDFWVLKGLFLSDTEHLAVNLWRFSLYRLPFAWYFISEWHKTFWKKRKNKYI